MPDKRALRAELRARLAALDADYISESDETIFQKVISLPQYLCAMRIFAYCSIGREVGTHAIIRHALSVGKTVCLPVVIGKEMVFYPVTEETAFQKGPFGIPQPTPSLRPEHPLQGDLMLMPGLSFTRSGERMGQGGGYYDRYLAAHEIYTVGLCRRAMLSESLPTQAHDRRADFVITD